MFLKIISFIAVIVQGLNLNGPKLVKWNSDADASQVNWSTKDVLRPQISDLESITKGILDLNRRFREIIWDI